MQFRDLVLTADTSVQTVRGVRPYINLDNAATTPPFKSVLQAVNDFAPWYSSVHRGSGLKSRLSTELYEEARRIVGEFVGANASEHVVIFGKNTSEAINKLSYRLGLRKTDVVLISHLEHHSNDVPWRARAVVKRIGLLPDGGIDRDDYLQLLERYDGRVRLVAISGASNVTGHLPDIHWFAEQAHKAGAEILVDCAQLAAHRAINMRALSDSAHLDYVAISGHKMYAPFGSGALIGRRDMFERGAPEYGGGGTILSVTVKHVDWAPPPESDEAGTPNVIGAVAMARAAKELKRIGFGAIAAHEAQLTAHALLSLREIPGLTLYGDQDPTQAPRRTGVVPFALEGVPANLVAAILGYEWGIGVRSGCFCAQPYVMSLLSSSPERVRSSILHHRRDLVAGLVRLSFGLYNTIEEIDVLAEALAAIASGQHGGYRVDRRSGVYSPVGGREDVSRHFAI